MTTIFLYYFLDLLPFNDSVLALLSKLRKKQEHYKKYHYGWLKEDDHSLMKKYTEKTCNSDYTL